MRSKGNHDQLTLNQHHNLCTRGNNLLYISNQSTPEYVLTTNISWDNYNNLLKYDAMSVFLKRLLDASQKQRLRRQDQVLHQ
jgi:hypothetical protein